MVPAIARAILKIAFVLACVVRTQKWQKAVEHFQDHPEDELKFFKPDNHPGSQRQASASFQSMIGTLGLIRPLHSLAKMLWALNPSVGFTPSCTAAHFSTVHGSFTIGISSHITWDKWAAIAAKKGKRQGVPCLSMDDDLQGPEAMGMLADSLKQLNAQKRNMSPLQELMLMGLSPDMLKVRLNMALSNYQKTGQWQEALEMMYDIKDSVGLEPDVISYSAAALACEKSGQWQQALLLLNEMQTTGVAPDNIDSSTISDASILMCSKLENLVLDLCAGTGRGQEMFYEEDSYKQELVQQAASQLKLRGSGQQASDALDAVQGAWELVYSNQPLFLATPFWWGVGAVLRSAFGNDATTSFFAIVLALSEGPLSARYGRILQNITKDRLVSDVDISLFNAPYAKLLTEAVLTSTKISGELQMALQQTRVLNSPLRALDNVALPLEAVFTSAPLPLLQTQYVGQKIRINRLAVEGGSGAPQLAIFQRADIADVVF